MIQLRDITKIYTLGDVETQVLKGVSFGVSQGEFVAIMGPSGSGKSTLMNIIGCLDVPTNGSYMLDSQDVSRLSDDELAGIRNKKIGFVFQSFNLLRRASVVRNVALPLVYAGMHARQRQERAFHALDIAAFPREFYGYLPNQLSGGMMQRVAIARALVTDPLLILADEPTGNLDTKTGETVLESLQQLNSEHGRTVILITHEMSVAQHARRILTLRDGLVVSDEQVAYRRILYQKT